MSCQETSHQGIRCGSSDEGETLILPVALKEQWNSPKRNEEMKVGKHTVLGSIGEVYDEKRLCGALEAWKEMNVLSRDVGGFLLHFQSLALKDVLSSHESISNKHELDAPTEEQKAKKPRLSDDAAVEADYSQMGQVVRYQMSRLKRTTSLLVTLDAAQTHLCRLVESMLEETKNNKGKNNDGAQSSPGGTVPKAA